ncbi:unnamed protein product [Amoebophrya sp. A25]|nr:unnamed protein product [Amoebophrya sp. A25]|eukprot:GSA25T00015624001.1
MEMQGGIGESVAFWAFLFSFQIVMVLSLMWFFASRSCDDEEKRFVKSIFNRKELASRRRDELYTDAVLNTYHLDIRESLAKI